MSPAVADRSRLKRPRPSQRPGEEHPPLLDEVGRLPEGGDREEDGHGDQDGEGNRIERAVCNDDQVRCVFESRSHGGEELYIEVMRQRNIVAYLLRHPQGWKNRLTEFLLVRAHTEWFSADYAGADSTLLWTNRLLNILLP